MFQAMSVLMAKPIMIPRWWEHLSRYMLNGQNLIIKHT